MTHLTLGSTEAMQVKSEHLKARREAALGAIVGTVGGHGGDVYWVSHEIGYYYACYCYDEFELASKEDHKPANKKAWDLLSVLDSDEL